MHQFDCPGGHVRGVDDLQVGYRTLSCYCSKCIDRDFEHCINKHIVGPMKRTQMRPHDESTMSVVEGYRETVDTWESEINYGLMAVPASGMFPSVTDPVGCWVAIKHDDQEYSDYLYYLMWVKKGPFQLKSPKIDGYGSSFSRGSVVLEGKYLSLCTDDTGQHVPEFLGRYTLDSEKAMCNVASVVYSGFTVDIVPEGSQVIYKIDEDTQRQIRDRINSVLC